MKELLLLVLGAVLIAVIALWHDPLFAIEMRRLRAIRDERSARFWLFLSCRCARLADLARRRGLIRGSRGLRAWAMRFWRKAAVCAGRKAWNGSGSAS